MSTTKPAFPHPISHDSMSAIDILLKEQLGVVSKCMLADEGGESSSQEETQCSVKTAIERASLIIDLIAEITKRYPKQTLTAFPDHCTAWEPMFKVRCYSLSLSSMVSS
jgi:hypothetical protein